MFRRFVEAALEFGSIFLRWDPRRKYFLESRRGEERAWQAWGGFSGLQVRWLVNCEVVESRRPDGWAPDFGAHRAQQITGGQHRSLLCGCAPPFG